MSLCLPNAYKKGLHWVDNQYIPTKWISEKLEVHWGYHTASQLVRQCGRSIWPHSQSSFCSLRPWVVHKIATGQPTYSSYLKPVKASKLLILYVNNRENNIFPWNTQKGALWLKGHLAWIFPFYPYDNPSRAVWTLNIKIGKKELGQLSRVLKRNINNFI